MRFFSKLERLSEKYIEGFFKTKFPEHIHPAEIAKLLTREMRDNKNISVSKTYVPNEYEVSIGNGDWDIIDPVQRSLSAELEEFLRKKAREKGYRLVGEVKVKFKHQPDLQLGAVNVSSSFTEGEIAVPDNKKPVTHNTIIADKEQVYAKVNDNLPQTTLTRITAPAPRPKAMLVQKMGTREGPIYPLENFSMLLGRKRTNDIRIDDVNISRVHASLDFVDCDYYITDLGSTNGTYVNGARVSKKKLVDGDVIRMGATVLEFRTR